MYSVINTILRYFLINGILLRMVDSLTIIQQYWNLCTNMPMSVNEAKEKGQCAVLAPGETLSTTVRIYAGEKR